MRLTGALLSVLVLTSPSAAQDDARLAEAQAQFQIGESLYQQGNFNGALAQYERVLGMLEGHPRQFFVRFNIAACQEALFRYAEAMENYRLYLSAGGPGAERAAEVQSAIQSLEARVGTIAIATNVGRAEVWVDGHRVGTAPGDVLVAVGQHALEVRAAGRAAARREISVSARSRQELRVDLAAAFSGISPALFATGAALTAASAGVGLVLGLIALDQHDTYAAWLASDDPALRYRVTEGAIADLQTLSIVSDVLLGTAVLFGATSVVLLFLTDWGGGSSSQASLRVLPWAGDRSGGLVLAGRLP